MFSVGGSGLSKCISQLVSVSDCPGAVAIRAHLRENSLGTQLPYDLKMPDIQATPVLAFWQRIPAQDQQSPRNGLK